MKNTTKSFLFGALAGVVLLVVLLVVGGVGFYWLMIKPMQKEMSGELRAPQLPSSQEYSFGGLELTRLSGKRYDSSILSGKVVLINAWAIWCPPCVAELPNLVSLRDKTQTNANVIVLCVSDMERDKQASFIKKKGYPEDMFLHSSSIMKEFGKRGIPATYIFDKKQRVIFHDVGAAKWDDNSVVEFLNELGRK